MYISRKIGPFGYSYRICESYFEQPYYKSRILLDLGTNPEKYVTYYSDVSFSIDIEEELSKVGVKTDQFELEELFLPFIKPEAKRWVQFSLNRKREIESKSLDFEVSEIHWFDRVRLIALKLDAKEPHRVINKRFPFFKFLIQKSRDEIENYLWNIEDRLNFRERFIYIYSIFSLQRVSSLEERDQKFLNTLCEVAKDPNYFHYLTEDEVLANYLARYVWMYFDFIPIRRVPKIYQEIEKGYLLEISRVLNVSMEVLLHSSKREVLKLFRQKLLEAHPDKGGSHEEFIKIRALMDFFIKRKN